MDAGFQGGAIGPQCGNCGPVGPSGFYGNSSEPIGGYGNPMHAGAPSGAIGLGHMMGPCALGGNGAPMMGNFTEAYGQDHSLACTVHNTTMAAAQALPQVIDGVPAKYEPVHVGLQNTKNTCYMNSFMQALFLTNQFLWRIFSFRLCLKPKPSKMDIEDHELGIKILAVFQQHMARMAVTNQKHLDIWNVLAAMPDIYRSGEQQDVTETIRFIFDKLGSFQQPLIREVFAGELSELTQCQVCMNVKAKPETFSDLVLPVPSVDEVQVAMVMPTVQALINQRLQFEYLDEDNMLECERCQQKQRHGKWSEIVSPPQQLCLCLNRFRFDMKAMNLIKEKTLIYVDPVLRIGPFSYELYMVIVHTGKDANSGHYYAIGKRAEAVDGNDWVTMDDSQVKPADMSILSGTCPDNKKDDNPYVLFYRCREAPPTPMLLVPRDLVEQARQEDAKQN